MLTWCFLLSSCSKVWHVTDTQIHNFNLDTTYVASDPEINAMIAPYKAQLDEIMGQVLIENQEIMYKQKPNSALGNWMSDALIREAQKVYQEPVDFALQNHGGIRIPNLPQGEVTVGKMYELMPFENMLLVLHAKGDVVQLLAERVVEYGGWPVSHELRIEQDDMEQVYVYINDVALDHNREYHFLIPDYIANGGDKCDFLKDQPRTELGLLLRDIFINDLKSLAAAGKKLEANKEIRIKL